MALIMHVSGLWTVPLLGVDSEVDCVLRTTVLVITKTKDSLKIPKDDRVDISRSSFLVFFI
jgi:hypothetical protein